MADKNIFRKSLAEVFPHLVKEWHRIGNSSLTPSNISYGSKKKVWWKCAKGHLWEEHVYRRSAGIGCPYCSGKRVCKDNNLAKVNPSVAREWHPTKNAPLTPKDVTSGSGKKVWWLCRQGHKWIARIADRKRFGCPYCSGRLPSKENSLAARYPKIANEWHTEKNGILKPWDVTHGSHKKVWWRCKNGHEWTARVYSRSAGRGCPHCYSGKSKKS